MEHHSFHSRGEENRQGSEIQPEMLPSDFSHRETGYGSKPWEEWADEQGEGPKFPPSFHDRMIKERWNGKREEGSEALWCNTAAGSGKTPHGRDGKKLKTPKTPEPR